MATKMIIHCDDVVVEETSNVLLKLLFAEIRNLNKRFNRLEEQANIINFKLKKVMQTLDELKALVEQENSVIDSAITLLNGLSEKIAALTPDQAAIDALATEVKAKSDALAAAITANTPVADANNG